jgi:hypothetical protein
MMEAKSHRHSRSGTPAPGMRCIPMTKAHEEKTDLAGRDKSQGDLVDGGKQRTPEGLQRKPTGPLDKDVGRKNETNKTETKEIAQ